MTQNSQLDSQLASQLQSLCDHGHSLPPDTIIKTKAQIEGVRQACRLTKQILDYKIIKYEANKTCTNFFYGKIDKKIYN